MGQKNFSYIDLFAGCGGLSLGLSLAGWKGIFAIEKNDMAFQTLSFNLIKKTRHFDWPDWLPLSSHDIDEMIVRYKKHLLKLKGSVNLVVGGPPCQGFSMAGKRRETDKRNKLIHSYIEFVNVVKPSIIFFENVKGFTQSFNKNGKAGKPYSEIVLNELRNIGYSDVSGEIIDFSDFGVPQTRKRFILIGTLAGNAPDFFETIYSARKAFLKHKGLRAKIGVKAAISDLYQSNGTTECPDSKDYNSSFYSTPKTNYQKLMRSYCEKIVIPNSHRFAVHKRSTIKIFQNIIKLATPNSNVSMDIKKRLGIKKRDVKLLSEKAPSPTVMSIPDDFVHFSEPRILTVRECARLQSFPDWFEFKGKYTTGGKRRVHEVPRYTQVGNAIPPLFAEHVGNVLKELLIR